MEGLFQEDAQRPAAKCGAYFVEVCAFPVILVIVFASIPFVNRTSVSTVGFPRESITSLALTFFIDNPDIDITFYY